MKLWLDDKRKPPWDYDLWAKTAKEAIAMLEEHGDAIEHCSLDHDLAAARSTSCARARNRARWLRQCWANRD